MKHPNNKIPDNYFDFVNTAIPNGSYLEKMAKYGDPSEFELPIPSKGDILGNMSYCGLYSKTKFLIFEALKGGKE